MMEDKPDAFQQLMNIERELRIKIGIDRLFPKARCKDISLLIANPGKGEQVAHSDFHMADGLVVCVLTHDTAESTRFWKMPLVVRERLVKAFHEQKNLNKGNYTARTAELFSKHFSREEFPPGTIPTYVVFVCLHLQS